MLRRSIALPNRYYQPSKHRHNFSSKVLPEPPKHTHGLDEEEHREARTWLARFSVKDIPKKLCETHFSRASGPGGQNVNKYVSPEVVHKLD